MEGAGQAQGMGGEVVVAQRGAGSGGVAHRVRQVERAPHGRHALLDGDVVGQIDARAGAGDAVLGPGQPGRHRRRRHEEGGGDRRRRHAAPQAQRQRDLGLLVDRRMAAQHDEAQLVVVDDRRVDDGLVGRLPRSVASAARAGARSRKRTRRRMRSMARRRAAVSSHASTESGTPRSGHVCRASRNASAVASSAMSTSRAMRSVAESTRPQYRRWAVAAAAAGSRHPAAKSQIGRTSM